LTSVEKTYIRERKLSLKNGAGKTGYPYAGERNKNLIPHM
jgi:hypothetical protein